MSAGTRPASVRHPRGIRAAPARYPRGKSHPRAEALKSNSSPPTSNPALSGTHPCAGFCRIPPDSAIVTVTAAVAAAVTTGTSTTVSTTLMTIGMMTMSSMITNGTGTSTSTDSNIIIGVTASTGNNIGTVIIGGNVNRWPCSLSHH